MAVALEASDDAWRRLAQFVRAARATASPKITQEVLSRRAGISVTTLRRLENQLGPVSEETLQAIDSAFGWPQGTCVEVLDGTSLSDRVRLVIERQRAVADELERLWMRMRPPPRR